eukprot:1156027-Pelagomonas_calceolata.AAC.11
MNRETCQCRPGARLRLLLHTGACWQHRGLVATILIVSSSSSISFLLHTGACWRPRDLTVPAGGIVIWRSAALCPSYSAVIARAGFDVRCVSRADQGYMDRCGFVDKGTRGGMPF